MTRIDIHGDRVLVQPAGAAATLHPQLYRRGVGRLFRPFAFAPHEAAVCRWATIMPPANAPVFAVQATIFADLRPAIAGAVARCWHCLACLSV